MSGVISRRDFASVLLADYVKREDVLCAGFAARTQLKAGKEPVWNLVFPRGTWHGKANFEKLGGSFTVDDAFIDEVITNYRAAGSPRLPVRWTHEHLKNADPAKVPLLDRKAANIIDLRATDAGLEGLTEWKPAGAKDIEDGVFDAWSAEWAPRHENRLTGKIGGWFLSGVALTSEPFFNLMPQLAANEMPPVAAANPTEPNPQHQEQPMNEEQKKLRASLGLAENATDAEVLAAQTKRNEQIATLTAEVTKLKGVDVKTLVAEAVKAATEPMQAQLKAAEEKALSLEIDQLIATAKAGDGKNGRAIADTVKPVLLKLVATEAKREDGIKAAKDYLEAIPLTVPVIATGTTGSTEPLTASAAGEKLKAEAEKLQKDGNITPWLSAVARNPELARIAQEGK